MEDDEQSAVRRCSLIPENIKRRSQGASRQEPASESSSDDDENAGKSLVEIHQLKQKTENNKLSKKEKKKAKKDAKKAARKAAKAEIAQKEEDIQTAIIAEKERIKNVNEMMAKGDERKRKYNSMHSVSQPTDAELEAFKRTKVNTADPMAQFLTK